MSDGWAKDHRVPEAHLCRGEDCPHCASLKERVSHRPKAQQDAVSSLNQAMVAASAAKAMQFHQDFVNYGLLLQTLSSEQFGEQIGTHFQNPYQCAIVTTLMARLIALEAKLGAEE